MAHQQTFAESMFDGLAGILMTIDAPCQLNWYFLLLLLMHWYMLLLEATVKFLSRKFSGIS